MLVRDATQRLNKQVEVGRKELLSLKAIANDHIETQQIHVQISAAFLC